MITSVEIAWVAGLLEGEGHFGMGSSNSPAIKVGMTDLDVIERFRILTRTLDVKIWAGPSKPGWKPSYYTSIYGDMAIQWMMTIYPLMGIRRKERIKGIIEKWKISNFRRKTAKFSPIKAIAKAQNISMQEAEVVFNSLMGKTVQ